MKKKKRQGQKTILFSFISKLIFTRTMNLKSIKNIWDYLKQNMLVVKESKTHKCST